VQNGWFACEIHRKALKALMGRNDATGLLWFSGWFASVIASGALAYLSLGTLWAVPAFALYGALFCFAEPIAHECTHGTPFHALPKLHDKIKDRLPRPSDGLAEAYREMAATFIGQQRDSSYFVRPDLPA